MSTFRRRHVNSTSFDSNDINPYSLAADIQTKRIIPSTFETTNNQSNDMTCRDRTNEFLSAVKSLQSRQSNGYVSAKKDLTYRSQFMLNAKKIGIDLANTFAKLEKLTILAKRKSLFDDKPVEIQQLTYIIKQDIGNLNNQIAHLQEASRSQRQGGKHKQTHSNSVVVVLQSKLASISNDFKSVLEVRTENLKQQKNRRDQFSSQTPVSSSMPPSAMSGYSGSILLQDEANSFNGCKSDTSINMDMDDRQRYQQQLQLIDESDTFIQNRADTMQNIEQTIVELGGIFTQLATMVKEQEEMVHRIDSNVEDTSLNVEAAHGEILKYFQSVTSNRWLMIKVFGILIVFFIIFVLFMA